MTVPGRGENPRGREDDDLAFPHTTTGIEPGSLCERSLNFD